MPPSLNPSHDRQLQKSLSGSTNQLEDLEEVQVGVEDVFYPLQPLLAQGAHGVADSVESHSTRENDEALQQRLAARYVLELKVRDPECKLRSSREHQRGFST